MLYKDLIDIREVYETREGNIGRCRSDKEMMIYLLQRFSLGPGEHLRRLKSVTPMQCLVLYSVNNLTSMGFSPTLFMAATDFLIWSQARVLSVKGGALFT